VDATTGLAGREGIVTAAMPVLARRALVAVGAGRTSSGDWLTAREQLVLERLALGMSVADIAAETGRSTHTVHDHVKSLHKKLGASSRGELISRALGHITEINPRPPKRPRGSAERVEEVKPGGRKVQATER
jgi:DNA-binding CsgD family transcriptional regulator